MPSRCRWPELVAQPTPLRRLAPAACALALAGFTSTSWATDPAELARGKQLFLTLQPACAVCHTLQAAGAQGQVGPVLDEIKPDANRVLSALRNGIGAMPSFAEKMTEKDMQAVARFVAHSTGAAPWRCDPLARAGPSACALALPCACRPAHPAVECLLPDRC